MKLIQVNDLSLQNEGYFAFRHVAFSLSQNQIIGLSGESGSGKTQLLEALAQENVPDSGTIEYTPGSRIGYLPQLDPQLIDQNVGKYLESIRRLSKKLAVRPEQLQGMITFLGMSPYIDTPVRQLSLGLRRRVGFLAAVAGHPNILLLDEPFAFQSQQTIEKMLSLMQDLKENGAGILVGSTEFSQTVQNSLDDQYLLKDAKLTPVKTVQPSEEKRLLVFAVNRNSVALPKELEKFVISIIDDQVELEIPLSLKDQVVAKMLQLNYRLKGVQKDENQNSL